jgi:hypothetical protein
MRPDRQQLPQVVFEEFAVAGLAGALLQHFQSIEHHQQRNGLQQCQRRLVRFHFGTRFEAARLGRELQQPFDEGVDAVFGIKAPEEQPPHWSPRSAVSPLQPVGDERGLAEAAEPGDGEDADAFVLRPVVQPLDHPRPLHVAVVLRRLVHPLLWDRGRRGPWGRGHGGRRRHCRPRLARQIRQNREERRMVLRPVGRYPDRIEQRFGVVLVPKDAPLPGRIGFGFS